MSELPVGALLIWAVIAGLDHASILQGLLNRPLVAGGVAGMIIGDVSAGLAIGGALELFALDVLPVGSTRYPDYGAAAVAAVAYGAGEPWSVALGPSVLLGLALGQAGGWATVLHRRANARALAGRVAALDRGERGTATRLHAIGISRDLVRSIALAALGLGAAALLLEFPRLDTVTSRSVTFVAVAGGVIATVGGALRRAGTVRRIGWLGAGIGLGLLSLGVW